MNYHLKTCLLIFISVQQLTGVARFNNGTVAEGRIDLRFDVEDENDNPPVFVPVPPATVNESSPAGKECCFLSPTLKMLSLCFHRYRAHTVTTTTATEKRNEPYQIQHIKQ